MAKRLAKASKSTGPLPTDYAPLLVDIKARVQADAEQTAGRDLRQTKLAKGKRGFSRHLDVAANELKVNPPTGDAGRFYQHHLSPARDSLAPARSALRAFAAAANS